MGSSHEVSVLASPFRGLACSCSISSRNPGNFLLALFAVNDVVRTASFSYNAITGLLESETIEPGGSSAVTLTTEYEHDAHGNRTKITRTGWKGDNLPDESGPTTVDRTDTIDDDNDGRYVDRRLNTYNHVLESVVTRNRYGSPTKVEDIATSEVDIAYGALGREYFRRDEVGGYTETSHRDCAAVSCPTGAAFRVHTEAAGGSESFAYFDLLGREVRTASRMFNGDWSVVLKEYEASGRLKHQSEPFSSSSPSAGNAVYWTTFIYDDLGRVVETRHPDYATTSNHTLVDYDEFETTTTNGLNQTHTETHNAVGELVRVDDYLGGYVTYAYDEQGNLSETVQGGPAVTAVTTTITHDVLGRKISMVDPDMGTWTYEYNAFGELIKQTNAKLDYTRVGYDQLGRMARRIDFIENGTTDVEESDSAWIYDTAQGAGLGKVHIEDLMVGTSTTPIRRTYTYDSHGRAGSITTEITRGANTETYVQSTTYDQYGRVFQKFDGAGPGTGLEYVYNSYGYLSSAKEAKNSAEVTETYYQINAMDHRGNVTQLYKGGVTVNHTFDPATGRPTGIDSENAAFETLQDLNLQFDVLGNLTSKQDQSRTEGGGSKNLTELYYYDGLNRLDYVTLNGTTTLDLGYDALGNITSKQAWTPGGSSDVNSNVGSYSYGAKPHAVTSAGGAIYIYDANGSMLSGDGRTIVYGVHNKPTYFGRGASTLHVYYGPNRNRYKRIDDVSDPNEKETHYVGNIEKIYTSSETVTMRYLDGEVIATRTETSSAISEDAAFLLKDHLGSTHMIVDGAGSIVQGMSFDPYGRRRADTSFASLTDTQIFMFNTSETTKGYTGHEGLDPIGLVHMNGRVFDPTLGRFLSADPHVQIPNNTQSYNRYSYVLNNPLSYTDPSGYFFKKLFKNSVFRTIASIAASAFIPGALAGVVGEIGANLTAGVAAGLISSDSLQGGVLGAFGAGMFMGIHNVAASARFTQNFGSAASLNTAGVIVKSTMHGLAGGVLNVLSGGKFGHGFTSAFVTQAAAGRVSRVGDHLTRSPRRVVASAIVGGTAARISGGKFANGAITGAFSRAFNDEKDLSSNTPGEKNEIRIDATSRMPDDHVDAVLITDEDFQHIVGEHSDVDDSQLKGGFRDEFLVDMNTFTKRILLPGLERTTDTSMAARSGRISFTSQLGYSVGRTGAFGGMPNVYTNTVKFVIAPIPGIEGAYRLVTAFPVRE